jgi:hypothetical protein
VLSNTDTSGVRKLDFSRTGQSAAVLAEPHVDSAQWTRAVVPNRPFSISSGLS